jgi:hypothetical protein
MLIRSALYWDITQRRVVIAYRRFGTYLAHLKGQMGPIRCPETSVKDYLSTLRNKPEERRYLTTSFKLLSRQTYSLRSVQ